MSHKLLLVFIAAVSSPPVLARQSEHAAINPIRRVVTMLQMMQKKVQAEGEKEQELFDKYMCWCATGGAGLKKIDRGGRNENPAAGEHNQRSWRGEGAAHGRC